MAEERILKELELGVRELFRIFVPGAYAVALLQLLMPDAKLSKVIAGRTTSGILAAFFLGIIGYALRAHERWFPYYLRFEEYRLRLKSEIDKVIGSKDQADNVATYKYFLETHATNVNDRIHYFTSFYYMLVELSLFSGLAGFFVVLDWLRAGTQQTHPRARLIGTAFVGVAIFLQLLVQVGLRSVRTTRTKMVLYAELIIGLVGPMIVFFAWYCGGSLNSSDISKLGWAPVVLVGIAYLFWRLGEKHWEQIVDEQLVLVNVKAQSLIEASTKFDPKSSRQE